jgi:hypothetical protein
MHFSQFAAYLNSTTLPTTLRREVRAEAIRRVTERMQSGRADGELTFTDLFQRCEAVVAGA